MFNIAQAHRLSGDCGQANRFYLNYKRLVAKPTNQAELDDAMAKCAGVPPATGDAISSKPAPAVDAPPALDSVPMVPVSPDPHPVVAPIEDDRAPHDGGKTLRLAGYAVAGAGGIAGVVAVVSALSARSKASVVADQPRGMPWSPTLVATEHDGQSAQTRSRIFGAIGVAAVITGGVLWWSGRRRSQLDVAITLSHTEVTLSCAF